MKNNNKKIWFIVLIICFVIVAIGITYAFINMTLMGTKQVVITAGTLDLVLEEENKITITDALPMYDEVGMTQEEVFVFRLINKTANDTEYILKLHEIGTGTLDKSDVKYGLIKDGETTIDLVSNITEGIIDEGTITGNDTIEYELRLWIDSKVTVNSEILSKTLSYRLEVEINQEIEEILEPYVDDSGANYPELTSGMIPVVYNETKSTWEKADLSEAWYDYDTQMWANAVTVTEDTRKTYMAAKAGTAISINDINTMWVWIPRYEYYSTNLDDSYAGGTLTQPGEIKVNFISEDTTSPSSSSYKIPEGFKFGTENTAGFWMAKFETSTIETCIPTEYDVATGCDLTTFTPQIIPNAAAWRGATVSTYFAASRNMQSDENADLYGFDVADEGTMNVHMLKNSEWGIVAYLSQSKYGKYGNALYTGTDKEVAINNCSSYITGIGGDTVSAEESDTTCTTNTYETVKGRAASTTGTIYGVYDMSGGAGEYIMGNVDGKSGHMPSLSSRFCGPTDNSQYVSTDCVEWPDAKYYDAYVTENYSILKYYPGDATYETGNCSVSSSYAHCDFNGWYSDWHDFSTVRYWVYRGSTYNGDVGSGVFAVGGWYGVSSDIFSARFAIKP